MSELRTWLSRTPQPSSLLVERLNGQPKPVRIGTSRSRWRDAESAVGDDYVRVEALDEKGALLRVLTSELAEEEAEKAAAKPAANENVEMLREFARLMTEACDRAVERQASMMTTAFEQLGGLVQLYAARNAMLEKAWHKLLVDSANAQAEAASDPAADAIMGGIVQMALTPPQQAATKNGKAKQ